MSVIQSAVIPRSSDFKANSERMVQLVQEIAGHAAAVTRGGPERARERHLARGKLLPRERVNRLLDPGSAPVPAQVSVDPLALQATLDPVDALHAE